MDPLTRKVLAELEGDQKPILEQRPLLSVAFSADGRLLAAGSEDAVYVWNMLTRERVTTLATGNQASCLAFAPDGRLFVGGRDLQENRGSWIFKVFDIASWNVQATFGQSKVSVHSATFSPDCRLLATANYGQSVSLWDVANGKVVDTLGTGPVDCVAFSIDGQLLATGGEQGVKLWDVAGRKELITLEARGWLRVNRVAFSPDRKILASGSADSCIRFWDVDAALKAKKSPITAPN
jgi:WD40 repeat protein